MSAAELDPDVNMQGSPGCHIAVQADGLLTRALSLCVVVAITAIGLVNVDDVGWIESPYASM